jgi:hypothetical protein
VYSDQCGSAVQADWASRGRAALYPTSPASPINCIAVENCTVEPVEGTVAAKVPPQRRPPAMLFMGTWEQYFRLTGSPSVSRWLESIYNIHPRAGFTCRLQLLIAEHLNLRYYTRQLQRSVSTVRVREQQKTRTVDEIGA